jgi:hypothetical protein
LGKNLDPGFLIFLLFYNMMTASILCTDSRHREQTETIRIDNFNYKNTIFTMATLTTTTTTLIQADPNKGIKVDAGIIAKPFRDEIKERVRQLNEQGFGTFAHSFIRLDSNKRPFVSLINYKSNLYWLFY